MKSFDLIISDPQVLGGKPCLKGTRISVDMVLEWFATGATIPALINQFPQLSEPAIQQALQYAAYLIQQEKIFEVKVA